MRDENTSTDAPGKGREMAVLMSALFVLIALLAFGVLARESRRSAQEIESTGTLAGEEGVTDAEGEPYLVVYARSETGEKVWYLYDRARNRRATLQSILKAVGEEYDAAHSYSLEIQETEDGRNVVLLDETTGEAAEITQLLPREENK